MAKMYTFAFLFIGLSFNEHINMYDYNNLSLTKFIEYQP